MHRALVGLVGVLTAGRVGLAVRDDEVNKCKMEGKFMCTIAWNPTDKINSVVQFPVDKCLTECLDTNGDFEHTKMFAELGFGLQEIGSRCVCTSKSQEGPSLPFSFPTPRTGCKKIECFKKWTRLLTNTRNEGTGQGGKGYTIESHSPLYRPDMFVYSNSDECKQATCNEPDCVPVANLNQVSDAMTDHDVELLREAEAGGRTLDEDDQTLLENLKMKEKMDAEKGLYESEPDLTVGKLRAKYLVLLEATGVDTNSLLRVTFKEEADNDDHRVSPEEFHQFLNPNC